MRSSRLILGHLTPKDILTGWDELLKTLGGQSAGGVGEEWSSEYSKGNMTMTDLPRLLLK
jgi:hypothetical protein